MKSILLGLFSLVLLHAQIVAQKASVKWSEEFRIKSGTTDLDVLHADKSGIYLQESHLVVTGIKLIGSSLRTSATLVKLDKNFSQVFTTGFNNELRGKEFLQFFVLKDKIFLIAVDMKNKDGAKIVQGVEVDKGTGLLKGMWKELVSIPGDMKKVEIDFKMGYNADSTSMVLVSSLNGTEKNTFYIHEFDETLASIGKPVQISNEFPKNTYQLADVICTNKKRIILVGRMYEYREGEKKKEKYLDFAQFNIRFYDETGKQIQELNTSVNGKWLTSAKVIQEQDKDLVLAGFYSEGRKDKTLDGLIVQRLDPVHGTVLATKEIAIDRSMLSSTVEDQSNEDDDKAGKKGSSKSDTKSTGNKGFSANMTFRKIFYTPDGGLVLLAEWYNHYMYTSELRSEYGKVERQINSVYDCDEILISKIAQSGELDWLKVLPKYQHEVISGPTSTSYGSGFSYQSFFDPVNRPLYAGFSSLQSNNKIHLFFNDHSHNESVIQPSQKVKLLKRFDKSHCFLVSIDLATGKLTRKMLIDNNDHPISMPRLGSSFGKEMYIVAKEVRFLGKSRIEVARISMN